MSYTTIARSTRDSELLDRITAALAKESYANDALGATGTGRLVMEAGPESVLRSFVWPSCIDFEAAYEYAVGAGNEHPGSDPGVITDANILAAVQAHWPDPPAEPGLDWTYDDVDPMGVALGSVPEGAAVQWGDGAVDGTEHTYANAGTYDLVVTPEGEMPVHFAVEVPNPQGGQP